MDIILKCCYSKQVEGEVKHVIMISGKRYSGKDTVAELLVKDLKVRV